MDTGTVDIKIEILQSQVDDNVLYFAAANSAGSSFIDVDTDSFMEGVMDLIHGYGFSDNVFEISLCKRPSLLVVRFNDEGCALAKIIGLMK